MPAAGTVLGLNVHMVGGVIGPGEPILNIVPDNDVFLVEARVAPNDIDRVKKNQAAKVRFPGLRSRSASVLMGKLSALSADLVTDPAIGEVFFEAKLEIPPEQLDLLGDLSLTAGIPADVLIETGQATAITYITDPIVTALDYAFLD